MGDSTVTTITGEGPQHVRESNSLRTKERQRTGGGFSGDGTTTQLGRDRDRRVRGASSKYPRSRDTSTTTEYAAITSAGRQRAKEFELETQSWPSLGEAQNSKPLHKSPSSQLSMEQRNKKGINWKPFPKEELVTPSLTSEKLTVTKMDTLQTNRRTHKVHQPSSSHPHTSSTTTSFSHFVPVSASTFVRPQPYSTFIPVVPPSTQSSFNSVSTTPITLLPADGGAKPLYNNKRTHRTGNRRRQYDFQTGQQRYYPVAVDTLLDGDALTEAIIKQVEHYFSVDNLCKDIYLRSNMDVSGYIPLALIAGFNRTRRLTSDVSLIEKALKSSSLIELSADGTNLRRKSDWQLWLLNDSKSEQINQVEKRDNEPLIKEKESNMDGPQASQESLPISVTILDMKQDHNNSTKDEDGKEGYLSSVYTITGDLNPSL